MANRKTVTILKNVEVRVMMERIETPTMHTEHWLELEIPLPGGKAVYAIPLEMSFAVNLETANTLAHVPFGRAVVSAFQGRSS